MNYLALAEWVERVAERERLGPPWDAGSSPKGMGAVLAVDEPGLASAVNQVGARCDWFTVSVYITVFIAYLRRNPREEVRVEPSRTTLVEDE